MRLATVTKPIHLGNILIESNKSPTGFAIFDPENRCLYPGEADKVRNHPLQAQAISADGLLLFKSTPLDILVFPRDGSGGPGTAAKTENRRWFAGPLAVGGLDVYGAAVQSDGYVSKVLLFEAYQRSHHQGTIWTGPAGSRVTWLGWGGKTRAHLLMLLREAEVDNLYMLEPTFPDMTMAARDCHYSTKRATDCMMKAIRAAPRQARLVLEKIVSLTIADQPRPPVPGTVDLPQSRNESRSITAGSTAQP